MLDYTSSKIDQQDLDKNFRQTKEDEFLDLNRLGKPLTDAAGTAGFLSTTNVKERSHFRASNRDLRLPVVRE